MARSNDRGPWVRGVAMRKVRAVSMGARMTADSAEEIRVRIRVVLGEAAVRMSMATDDVVPSSGRPKRADRRLRMKVLRVGRSSE